MKSTNNWKKQLKETIEKNIIQTNFKNKNINSSSQFGALRRKYKCNFTNVLVSLKCVYCHTVFIKHLSYISLISGYEPQIKQTFKKYLMNSQLCQYLSIDIVKMIVSSFKKLQGHCVVWGSVHKLRRDIFAHFLPSKYPK